MRIMEDKKHLIGDLELSPKFVVVKLGIVDGQPSVLVDSFLSRSLALRNTIVGKSTRVGADYEKMMINELWI